MKAVILAAGIGKRLKPLTNNLPKAFLPIDGIPLIHYSLNNLKNSDITSVTIVVGFMEDFIKKKLGNTFNGIDITYVSNKEYANTGSMYSLSQTEKIVDDDIILLESDLIYEKKSITELIKHPYPNVILTASIRNSGDEVYIHTDEEGYLKNLGKNIEKADAIGELVGISKLSFSFFKKLCKIAEEDYEKGERNYHYEEVIYKLSKNTPVKCLLKKDLLWTEIDYYNDLEKATKEIYSKIKIKEDINCG